MRASSVLLALPALSAAQQIPLLDNVVGQIKGFFAQASETASSAIPAASSAAASIPNPIDAATAKVAEVQVPALTLANHKELIQPGAATASPGIDEWMVFVTGGNATCFGTCKRPEEAFNGSVTLLSATPNPPSLAYLNCDQDPVLCNAWGVSPPRVLHIQLPQPLADQSTPATTVRAISFNRTTISAPEIAAIHLQETYKQTAPYEGFFHPFNGPLAEYGLAIPVGYAIWGFSKIPSWAFMIGVSFISRNIMYVSCVNKGLTTRILTISLGEDKLPAALPLPLLLLPRSKAKELTSSLSRQERDKLFIIAHREFPSSVVKFAVRDGIPPSTRLGLARNTINNFCKAPIIFWIREIPWNDYLLGTSRSLNEKACNFSKNWFLFILRRTKQRKDGVDHT
jgi:hypothetical protein